MNSNTRHTYLLPEATDPRKWESALYAFLAEKHRRTGSMRTVQRYSHTLRYFFVRMQKTQDQVTSAEVKSFCFGRGLSGREPAAINIGRAHGVRETQVGNIGPATNSYPVRTALVDFGQQEVAIGYVKCD